MWLLKLNNYKRYFSLHRIGWVLFAGILFYCYEFFLRILTGAYQNEITGYFKINSHFGFSFLVSSYNFTYVLMQIPAGILLDKFGSRKCLSLATVICGFGSAMFTLGGYQLALFSRLLVGLGSSFAFIGVLKLSREYLPKKYFGFFASIIISFGTLAGALSQQISILLSDYHIIWQGIFVYGGLLSLPLACLFSMAIPSKKSDEKSWIDLSLLKAESAKLLSNKLLWLNAIWAGCVYVPMVVITSQYGVYIFKEMFQVTQYQATTMITTLLLGWILFSPILIYIITKSSSLDKLVTLLLLLMMANLLLIIFLPTYVIHYLTLTLFFLGVFSSVQVMVWQYFNQICDEAVSGIGIAFTTMIIAGISEIGQLLSGITLDLSNLMHLRNHHGLFNYNSQVMMLLFVFFILVGWYIFYRFRKYYMVSTNQSSNYWT